MMTFSNNYNQISETLSLLFNSPFFVAKIKLLNHFKKASPELTGTVLDLGCGRKPFLDFLKCEIYYGMEYNTNLNPDFCGDVLNLPVKEECIDSIILGEVLEHVREPGLVIREINKVLKKGGKLYLTAPMLWYLHYEPHDYYRFTRYALSYILEKNNFDIIWINRCGGLNYFIANRVSETLYKLLVKITKVTMLSGKVRERLCLFLLAPIQIILYVYATLFDMFNKRDAAGYSVLAKKR